MFNHFYGGIFETFNFEPGNENIEYRRNKFYKETFPRRSNEILHFPGRIKKYFDTIVRNYYRDNF